MYQSSMKKKIFTVAIIYLFLFTTKIVVVLGTGYIAISFMNHSDYNSFWGIICITIIQLMISMLIDHFFNIRHDEDISQPYFACILFVPISSIVIIFLAINHGDFSKRAVIVILTILLNINLAVFYLFDRLLKSEQYKNEVSLMSLQNSLYKKNDELMQAFHDSMKNFRHDIINHSIVLMGYLKANKAEEASVYLDNIMGEYKWADYVHTGRMALDNIINFKMHEAKLTNITLETEVAVPVEMNIEDFDLTVIIGNLLDNALDAVKELSINERFIKMRIRYDRGRLIIKSVNKSNGTLKYNKSGEILTTKISSEHQGLGIKKIKNAVCNYGGDTLFTLGEDGLFTAFIVLYVGVKLQSPSQAVREGK